MAHFAKINANNIVESVIVVNNDVIQDENGNEVEQIGIDFCKSIFGQDTNWVQTSYNNNFRKRYAGINYSYDAQLDAFIPPKPFESWTLNTIECIWEAPVPYPNDGNVYFWNEPTVSWVLQS